MACTQVDGLPPHDGKATSLMRMNPRTPSLPGGVLNKEGHGGGSTRARLLPVSVPYWPASALYGLGRDWHGHISSELVSVCSFNNVRPDAGCDHSIPRAEDLDHGQKLYCS